MIKNAIKNRIYETDFYPNIDDFKNTDNEFIPPSLQTFMKELVKSPVKQNSLSQVIFAVSRSRIVMSLLFELDVASDNEYHQSGLTMFCINVGL